MTETIDATLHLDRFAPYLMNRIMGRYNAALQDEMAQIGLTTPQMRALAVLSVRDAILIHELAVYAVVPQSTLSRALEPLTRQGLIARTPDAQDNRATRLSLTAEGRAVFDRLWPHMQTAQRQMFEGIDPAARAAFVDTLHHILRNLRTHDF